MILVDPKLASGQSGPNVSTETAGRRNQAAVLGHKGKAACTSKAVSATDHTVTVWQRALCATHGA